MRRDLGLCLRDVGAISFLSLSVPSSAAAPTCIWMSISASHRISSAVHEIGTALDVLQEIHGCILSSFSSPYMAILCCNVLGRDWSIPSLRA